MYHNIAMAGVSNGVSNGADNAEEVTIQNPNLDSRLGLLGPQVKKVGGVMESNSQFADF